MRENEFIIRRAVLEDVEPLSELDRNCFSIPWSRQSFADEIVNPMAIYYVAEGKSGIIGYCGFWSVAGEGQITNICTHPSFRRIGAARALLAAALKHASLLQLSLMTLEVRESNYAAKNLYAQFGFENIGRRKRYYSDNNEDAVIMTKYF